MNKFVKRICILMIAIFFSTGFFAINPSRVVNNPFCFSVEAASVKLNKTSVTLIKGKKYTLAMIGTNQKVSWSSSNTSIATVSKKGVVTAKDKGVTIINAKVAGKTYKCKVKVEVPKISKTKLVLLKGTKSTLKISGTTLSVKWKSSDSSIATVSKKGVVTAKDKGVTTVKATVCGKSYTCKVKVETPSLSTTNLVLIKGTSSKLTLSDTSLPIVWNSSDTSIATVSSQGVVSAQNKGTTTIVAKAGGKAFACAVTVEAPKLSQTKLILIKDTTATLHLTDTSLPIIWASSDVSIATVSSEGVVSAKASGITTITAKVGGQSYTCQVTVEAPQLSMTELVLIKGTASKLALNNTTASVSWKSSDDSIATVLSDGVVSAKNNGTATIIATVGSKTYSCKVTVETPTISTTKITLAKGNSSVIKMSNTTLSVSWKSSNPSVATVSSDGTVTAIEKGVATITATVGSVDYNCTVTVEENSQILNTPLCSDENISISLYKIEDGQMIFNIENKAQTDCSVGLEYLDFYGKTYYDELYVINAYAGVTRSYLINNDQIGEYYFGGGQLKGCFSYRFEDTPTVYLKFNKNIETSLEKGKENIESEISALLCEDENIVVYIIKADDGLIHLKIYNKSNEDYEFGLNYIAFNNKTYFDELYVTRIFAGMNKYYVIDEDNVGESFSFTGGEISGSFEYYSYNSSKGTIKFNTEISF